MTTRRMTAHATFTLAGQRDGTALVRHACARFGVACLSEQPSSPGDPHVIPGCGCRPLVPLPSEALAAEHPEAESAGGSA